MAESVTHYPDYADFVRGCYKITGNPAVDFTHAVLGIVTEVHEMHEATDEINGLEELGDMEFYVVALKQVLQSFFGAALRYPETGTDFNATRAEVHLVGVRACIARRGNVLLDAAKRWIAYDRPPGDPVALFLGACEMVHLANITSPYVCTDVAKIREANMRKLFKRYPAGTFDATQALERDVAAERAAIVTA